MKTTLALAFVLAFASTALATPLDDKLKSFTDALKTARAGETAKTGAAALEEPMMPFLPDPNQAGGDAQLEATIRQLMATNSSPEVQRAGQAVLDEIEARRKERVQAAADKIDTVLKSAPNVLAHATKPVELDGLLADLQSAMPTTNPYGQDPGLQAQINRLNGAYQMVSQWQDYLATRDANPQEALNTLRNLSNSREASAPALLPRSEILAEITTLEARTKPGPVASPYPQFDITPILDGVKTLDDLDLAVQKLPPNIANQGNSTASGLIQLAAVYDEAKNGLQVSLDFEPAYINPASFQIGLDRIKAMLLLYLLPRYLGPLAPPPNADEPVNAYLDRVTASAEAAQNWLLLERVILAKLKIAHPQVTPPGVQSFLTGLNQEVADQYALAVPSYETALRQPDDFTPVSVIGDRLAAIKKDHANDFETGMKNVLNPPTPAYINPYAARFALPGYTFPGVAPASSLPPATTTLVPSAAPSVPKTNAPSGK